LRNLVDTCLPLTLCLVAGIAGASQLSIDEIVVTATRRPTNIAEVSESLTVIDSDVVRSSILVTDALADGIGLYLQQTTPGQGAAIIRGLKGSALLHLVDGIRLNNAIFRSAPTQYFALVPSTAVQRIEVIRGSPASLYGSDAIGGVVQVVTRVPEFNSDTLTSQGDIFAAYETADLARILRGTLDLGTSRLASSMSAELLQTGDRRTGSGDRMAPSGYDSYAGRFLLSATPSDDRRWLMDIHWLTQPETPRFDELVPGYGQSEPGSAEDSFKPNERVFVHGKHARDASWLGLDWTFDLAWQRIVDDRVSRDYQSTVRQFEKNRSDLSAIAASASQRTESGSWIVGVDLYDDRVASERYEIDLPTGPASALAPRFPDGSTVRQSSVFANIDGRVLPRHSMSGGLRLTGVDIDLAGSVTTPVATINENDWSADIGWIFDVSNGWQLAANVGLGFRAPNIFDLGTLGNRPGNRFNIPNSNLNSENVLQGDVGIRRKSDRMSVEFVAYALHYNDRITSVLTGATTPDGRDIVQSINAATSDIRGVETGMHLSLTSDISVHAVLNYTWGTQSIESESLEPADRIPPLSGMISARFSHSPGVAIEGLLRFAALQDRLSARDAGDSRIDPNGTSGWGILGFRSSWQAADHWTMSAGIDNLLDKQYRAHGSGIDAEGRNFSASVNYRW